MQSRSGGGFTFIVLFTSILMATVSIAPTTATRVSAAPADHTVCLSPGHGPDAPGATNGALEEWTLNWTIAEALASKLGADGYRVVYTHAYGENPDGTARAQACNKANADTVLWIHLNSSSDNTVDYFKAFWSKKRKDEAFCQKLTARFELRALEEHNTAADGYLTRQSVGQFASSVMLKSNAPACLVENVFLSNTAEADVFSNSPGVRENEIAQELYDGLTAWYGAP